MVSSDCFLAWLSRVVSFLDKTVRFDHWLHTTGIIVFFLMTVLTFFDVGLRYIFNRPIRGSFEVIELMLVIVVFFGGAYTLQHKSHVGIDLLVKRQSPKVQVIFNSFTSFLSIVVLCLVIWQTIIEGLRLREVGEQTTTLFLPLSPFMLIVSFGCTLLLILLIRDLLNYLVEGLNLHLSHAQWLLLFAIPILVMAVIALSVHPALGLGAGLNKSLVGVLALIAILVLFFCGMPIAFTLLLVGFIGLAFITGDVNASLYHMAKTLFRNTASYNWVVMAFFVLMGYYCLWSQLGRDLYYTAYRWVGAQPGGLAISTVVACTAFGAAIGDPMVATVTMGAVSVPEMKRYKYAQTLATGCVCSGSTIAVLIPPSIPFIIFALLTETSIADLFIAGIFPGLLFMVVWSVMIYIRCRLDPSLGPRGEKPNIRQRLSSLRAGGPIAFLFLLILGGIYAGIMSPTEAGAVGACGALLIGLSMRRFNWHTFLGALRDGGRLTSMMFFMLGGATVFSYMLSSSKLPFIIADAIVAAALPPLGVLLSALFLFLVFGCFMPAMPLLLIGVPLFFPIIVLGLGYDPIWFGVIVVLAMCFAAITPPYGVALFALKAIQRDIPIGTIFRGVIPFVGTGLISVGLIIAFPQIAIWLPKWLRALG